MNKEQKKFLSINNFSLKDNIVIENNCSNTSIELLYDTKTHLFHLHIFDTIFKEINNNDISKFQYDLLYKIKILQHLNSLK